MVGLAAHLKPQGIFGFGVSQDHPGFITLTVDLSHGGSRGDHQDLGIIQMEQITFHDPLYLALEGPK